MAKKQKKAAGETQAPDVYSVIDLLGVTDNMEFVQRKFKMSGSTTDIAARKGTQVSTGSLMYDVLLGGGVFPGGWYTIVGGEGSAKSTSMMTMSTSFQSSGVPFVDYRDAEGAMSPDYIERISEAVMQGKQKFDIKNMFGIKAANGKDWVIKPRVYISNDNSLEQFYKSVSAFLKRLPDKIYVDGEWWLFFDNTKENIARFKGQHDTAMGKRYGKIAMRSLDGGTAQGLILLDSLPSLISDADEEDDGNNSIGLNARGHSKHYAKVRGKLKRKHVTIIAINQLRDSINLTGHGPKFYEPGGHAVKYASDVRVWHSTRAVPHASGQIEEEASVQYKKGKDVYRYLCLKTHKNKYGTPYLEVWMRLWAADAKGVGHGFCPVWDTFEYLKTTGQIDGSMGRGFSVKMKDGLELPKMKWLDFKGLILLKGNELKELCKTLKIEANPKIRDRCFKQMKSGTGQELYLNHLQGMDEPDEDDLTTWSKDDLVEEAVGCELGTEKELKKLKESKLIKMIEGAWATMEEEADEDEEEEEDED